MPSTSHSPQQEWVDTATGGAGERGVRRLETLLHVFLVVLLPALVFTNTIENGYHLDDIYRVRDNTELDQVHPVWRHFVDPRTSATLPTLVQYRPLLPLTLSLSAAASDALGIPRLVGHHLGNILVHVAACLLLYGLFRELLTHWSSTRAPRAARERAALGAALLFSVHPIAGVPVNYVCGRDLLLMLLFLAGAGWAYVHWRRLGGWWKVPLAFAPLLLSLASKTNAIVAPALVLAFETVLARERWLARPLWIRVGGAGACVAGFLAFTKFALDFSDAGQLLIERSSPLEYPATQLELHLSYYARNVVWPLRMRALPWVDAVRSPADVGMWLGAAFVAASLWAALRLRRSAPLVTFCILSYWALFVPTSSFLTLRTFATDYRQVPSLAFLFLLLAALAVRWLGAGPQRVLAATAIALAAAASVHMNRTWKDEKSFWGQSVRYGGKALAHVNYAVSVRSEDPPLAEEHLKRALELYPNHVFAHINLGLLSVAEGRTDEGVRWLERAIEIEPDWAVTRYWCSFGFADAGLVEEAADSAWRARELDPRNAQYAPRAVATLYEAARGLQVAGRAAESLRHLERLHTLVDSHADSLFLEGFALQSAGRDAEATERYRRFLAGAPTHRQALFNLAYAEMRQENHEVAVELFRKTLAHAPDYREAHLHLATCLEALGRLDEAARERAHYDEE